MCFRYGKSVLFWILKGKVLNNLAFIATLGTANLNSLNLNLQQQQKPLFCTIENLRANFFLPIQINGNFAWTTYKITSLQIYILFILFNYKYQLFILYHIDK